MDSVFLDTLDLLEDYLLRRESFLDLNRVFEIHAHMQANLIVHRPTLEKSKAELIKDDK